MDAAHGVNAGPRLDRLPISRFHWRVLALISCGGVLDAFDVYLAGGVLAAAKAEGFSTMGQAATFLSVTSVGMLIGALLAGYMGDRKGRRYSYQFNLWLFGLASFAGALSPTMDFLILCRLIMGIGLGAEFVVAAGTLGEFIPPRYRGRWASVMGLLTSSGLLISTAVGYFVIPSIGWRYMFVIAGTGATIVCLMRKQMPESPRWLESVGRLDEASSVLDAIEAEVAATKGPLPPVRATVQTATVAAPTTRLFKTPLLARLLTASCVTIAVNTSVYGLVTWLPIFLTSHGHSVGESLAVTTWMSFGSVAGSAAGIAIADRVPRRVGLIGAAIAIVIFGLVYLSASGFVFVALSGFLLVSSIYTLSNQGMYSYVPELFPTAYRLRGTGFAGTSARALAIVTPFLTIYLFADFGLAGVLAMVFSLLATMVIAVTCLKVEASGRSLDELAPPPPQPKRSE